MQITGVSPALPEDETELPTAALDEPLVTIAAAAATARASGVTLGPIDDKQVGEIAAPPLAVA